MRSLARSPQVSGHLRALHRLLSPRGARSGRGRCSQSPCGGTAAALNHTHSHALPGSIIDSRPRELGQQIQTLTVRKEPSHINIYSPFKCFSCRRQLRTKDMVY